MSLIICSNNRSDADEAVGSTGGVFEPYSFRNQLTSNVDIPANAQVALQSAKINMDGTIVLGDDTKVFYMYFGPAIVGPQFAATQIGNIMDSPQIPIRVPLFADNNGRLESLSVLDLAVEIQRSVRERLSNPNLKDRFTCIADFAASGAFSGFKWSFNEAITGGGATQYAPISILPPVFNHLATKQRGMMEAIKSGRRNFQITNGGIGVAPPWGYGNLTGARPGQFRITQPGAQSQAIIGNVSPLNLKGGVCKYRITDVANIGGGSGRFMCGLTRGSRGASVNQQGRIRPPGYRPGNGIIAKPWLAAFMDYFVYFNAQQGTTAQDFGPALARGHLRIGHSVVNVNDTGGNNGGQPGNAERMKFSDFKYGDGNGGSVNTGTDALVIASTDWSNDFGYSLATNSLNIEFIIFKVEGGRVTISMESTLAAGSIVYPLVTYEKGRNADLNLKPITQTCENLLPSMLLNNSGLAGAGGNTQIIEIIQWTGNNVSCLNYDFLSDDMTKNGFFDRLYTGDPATRGQIARLDTIQCVNYSNAFAGAPNQLADYMGFNSAGNKEFTDVDHIWLVKPNEEYGGPGSMLIAGANTSNFLGLSGTPILRSWTLTAAFNRENASISLPQLLPTRSVFVRLENFGNESVNAFQGLRSKIIAHLPRFDGLHSVGPLFLEPNNLVYVDLKNPSAFKINSFDVSLCYSDETFATSLQGTTIIVLHIKEKGS